MGSRRTQQEQFEDNVLHEFYEVLSRLKDPRRAQGRRYPLESVVVSALMAMVCGCDDAEAMSVWSRVNEDWLTGFLSLPHGSPSQDVYLSVFSSIDPIAFADLFAQWVLLLRGRLTESFSHIAIDGKTTRGSHDYAADRLALHTVSAWTSDAGLVLAQRYVDAHSNEIEAIPELLKLLDLRGATVTMDAMGCQKSIVGQITRADGDYLLAVKANQKSLHDDIVTIFDDALDTTDRALDQPAPLEIESHETIEKGHGRIETRRTHICRNIAWLTTRSHWRKLSVVVMCESIRESIKTGKVTTERRYYIASDPTLTAERAAHLIRRHWGIENEVHWILDIAMREDHLRHRAGNCAANMGVLRKTALNLLKADNTIKLGVANKRKIAGWDRDYLMKLLVGQN